MRQWATMKELGPISRREFNEKAGKALLAGGGLLLSALSPDSIQTGPMTLDKAVGSDGLNLVQWELDNAPSRLMQMFWERTQPIPPQQVRLVQEYFSLSPRPVALEKNVERIMTGQIKRAFEEEGIYSRVPLAFRFIDTPKSIAISPRDRIEITGQMPLRFGMTLSEIEALEDKVETLLSGLSALVFDCLGWATWPAEVIRGLPDDSTFITVAHEITHQMLAPTPLGRPYTASFLGFPRNNEIAALNETCADIIGQKVGRIIMNRYYRQNQPGIKEAAYAKVSKDPTANRDRVLRETRISVDWYLKQGRINEAERLMEKTREDLGAAGFLFRKLNQAFFAISGTYTDGPSSTDPIGEYMKKLSERYSLRDFFGIVSNVVSFAELQKAA